VLKQGEKQDGTMHILYATDGSEGALAAARWLAPLPLGLDDQVTLLTVVSPQDATDGQAALDAARELLSHSTAGLSTQVRAGNPAEAILQVAEEHPTDLLVVGSRGLSAVARFFLGSVAERVARHASCPVLLVRPLEGELRRVVVGVDGSKDAAHAGAWVQRFPLPQECEFRLVTVLPFVEDFVRTRMLMPPQVISHEEALAYADQQLRAAQDHLEALAASFTQGGKRVSTEIRRGEPAPGLLDVAQEQGADLIVVGAQGLSAIERFFMGSVSENVLRHAHCSVLIVKNQKQPGR
jgi:nucleotide-binding universal stress UspA family protein